MMTDKPVSPHNLIRTMQEFSAYVGLSRQTISKYFRDPTSIHPTNRERIEAAIERSGFYPNFFAANLKRRQSRLLGVIIPDTIDPFYMELVNYIEYHATQADYFMLMLNSGGRYDTETEAIHRLRASNAAGILIASSGKIHPKAPLPLIHIDSPPEADGFFIGTDNFQSIGEITRYLCQSGSPPCYLGMPSVNRNAEIRRQAYFNAMDALGETPHELTLQGKNSWDFESYGYHNATAHFEQGLPTNTLLCANDRIAIGAQLAAWRAGLKVGKGADCDLRIAGHDDHPFSRYASPPLTTVVQNTERIAYHAVTNLRRLCGEMDGAVEQVLVPAQLTIRESA